ncbi:MAG: ECF-type sigma factor [Phycisphaerales bacterium JB063]
MTIDEPSQPEESAETPAVPDSGDTSPEAKIGGEDEHGGGTPTLFGVVYDQLRGLAQNRMRHERVGQTLQPTALVHEVYLRLMKDPDVAWANPRHFFAAAAESMRRILIEKAREKGALKRGGDRGRVSMDDLDLAADVPSDKVFALDEALNELKKQDPRMAEVVMLRYFAGLSVEETAAAMEVSPRTVKREWSVARAWLIQRIGE